MKAAYQIANRGDSRALAEFLSQEGQLLLPMLELITQAEMSVDELIDVAGRATIEAILKLSAQEVAGPKHPGKATGAIRWHGGQNGVVSLAERKLRAPKSFPSRISKTRGIGSQSPRIDRMPLTKRPMPSATVSFSKAP